MVIPSSFIVAPSSPPAPSPGAIARSIGGIPLNDRTTTAWDHLDVPGTRTMQTEELDGRDGEAAIVSVDRKMLEMVVYLVFYESPSNMFEDWARNLENVTAGGAEFITGDGFKYQQCWAHDISGKSAVNRPRGQRIMSVTFKVTSKYTYRIAA